MIFSNSLIVKVFSEDFCLNFSYCLVVVNLCFAVEKIVIFCVCSLCFCLLFKQFHFATVALTNNNIRKQVYMAFEHGLFNK